ncbi:hypothetical protein [Haloprofundus halobius]|uniref:hypothetical protein n=1 Tax=Haloprofundus halobius TaxID=2876194 RepID=UPI001CCAC239|nr:hypothetical protein [Haloprofundus halobius]
MSSISTNVFLVPCDPGNFDRTVRSKVDLNDYPDCPDSFADSGEVHFWGARDGSNNRAYFEKMSKGDLVLFYQNGTYVGVGWIGTTFEDQKNWASTTFWRNAPSNLIYTITEFTTTSVPRAVVNEVFDYNATYYPQGLTRVAEGRVANSPERIKSRIEGYGQ